MKILILLLSLMFSGGCQPEKNYWVETQHYLRAIHYIEWRETRCGTSQLYNPLSVGPAGERGTFQVTPIFQREVFRIAKFQFNPHKYYETQWAIYLYLKYWASRTRAETLPEIYALYRYGPDWREDLELETRAKRPVERGVWLESLGDEVH